MTEIKVTLINLTPHPISIADEAGHIIRTIPVGGQPVRVSSTQTEILPRLDDVPFVLTSFGEVENLPESVPGMVYIVSQFVIAAVPDRPDLVRPDTGQTALRDSEGRIIAVRALTR